MKTKPIRIGNRTFDMRGLTEEEATAIAKGMDEHEARRISYRWGDRTLRIDPNVIGSFEDLYGESFSPALKGLLTKMSSAGSDARALAAVCSFTGDAPDYNWLESDPDAALSAAVEGYFGELCSRAIESSPEVLESLGLDPVDYGH